MQTITHWNQIEQIPPFPPPHPQFMEGLVTTPHPGLAMEWSLCLSASPDLVPFLDRAIHATSSCTTQSGGEAGPTERGHQEVRELANIISSSCAFLPINLLALLYFLANSSGYAYSLTQGAWAAAGYISPLICLFVCWSFLSLHIALRLQHG